jgi:hypothetical protein
LWYWIAAPASKFIKPFKQENALNTGNSTIITTPSTQNQKHTFSFIGVGLIKTAFRGKDLYTYVNSYASLVVTLK